jgi:hypothetical protein
VLETPAVAIGEAVGAAVRKGDSGSDGRHTTSTAIRHGLVHGGPVDVVPTDEPDLVVFWGLVDRSSR